LRGWIISQDYFEQLHDMLTAVHETSHQFTHFYPYMKLSEQNMNTDMYSAYWYYFIDRGKAVVVETIDLPPVSIIIDAVPLMLRKDT
jgi:hypothetical protein